MIKTRRKEILPDVAGRTTPIRDAMHQGRFDAGDR